MKREMKSILKKTVKIAGVTCLAVGAAAIVTSGAALKALEAGGKHLAGTINKITAETSAEEIGS